MREISRNAGGVDDIVESQLVDVRRSLEEERQRLERRRLVSPSGENTKKRKNEAYLANATRSASNNCVKGQKQLNIGP